MVHLQSLPTELLDRILSFLADSSGESLGKEHHCCGTADLYNACLVSQQFRNLAQPLLFRNFNADDTDDPLNLLIRFTKCVYLRPALGEHLRTLSIAALDNGDFYGEPELAPELVDMIPGPQVDPEDLKFVQKSIRDLDLGDLEKQWLKALESWQFSPVVALLAHRTPNLRALRMPHDPVIRDALTSLCRRDEKFLPNLDRLWMICYEPLETGYDIGSYNDVLSLRKITSPTFEFADLPGKTFPSSWKPGTLAFEELAFNHCRIDALGINKLMQACKRVKSFIYQNFALTQDDARDEALELPEFNAAEVHAAVLPHRDSLEHFHLEYLREPWETPTPDAYREYCECCVKLPSFQNFPVLETIIIQHALLPDFPRFPPSLQRLDITDCNSSIRDMATDIASDCKRGKYPRLTDFKVLTTDITKPIKLPGQIVPPGMTPAQCFRSLQDLFKGTSVDFQIFPYDIPDPLDDGYDDADEEDDPDGPFALEDPPNGAQLLSQLMMVAANSPQFAAMMAGMANHEWQAGSEDSD